MSVPTEVTSALAIARASIDALENAIEAAFEEPPPPPLVIDSVDVSAITQTGATVGIHLVAPGPARTWYRPAGTTTWLAGPNETSSTYQDHVQQLTGLTPGTAYEVRAEASGDVSGVVAFTTLAAQPAGLPGLVTYGGGVNMHGLNNLRLGWSGSFRLVAMAFRARYSLPLQDVRWYKEVGSGYSAGNGGSGRVWVYPDGGGSPDFDATPLASTPVASWGTNKQVGRLDTFTASSPLTAGERYWLVWEKTETGNTNYVSLNCQHPWSGADAVHPHRRFESPDDYRTLWGTRTSLSLPDNKFGWLPCHELRYANGEYQGSTYMEIGHQTDILNVGVVNGSRRIRQRWTHSGPDVVVDGIGIAMQRASSSTADLQCALKAGAATLATAQIPGTFPVGGTNAGDFRNPGGDYRRADLSAPVTLHDGVTYDVESWTTGNGHMLAWGLRRGSEGFGYSGQGEWPDGRAQISVNGGSSWYDLTHWGMRYDYDAYLERA